VSIEGDGITGFMLLIMEDQQGFMNILTT